MPTLIVVLIVMALFYQMFFRFQTHESDKNPDVLIERDGLTGHERVLKAGTKVSVIDHLVGSDDDSSKKDGTMLQPWGADDQETKTDHTPSKQSAAPDHASGRIDFNDQHQVEQAARPVPVPREVVVASSAPPVPASGASEEPASIAANVASKPFAIRQIDLNKDGAKEEIIQNATQADGLLDISIVKDGREIFFGRGQQISLLPSTNQGWSDIVLKMGVKTLQVFRYDPKDSAYRALEHKS